MDEAEGLEVFVKEIGLPEFVMITAFKNGGCFLLGKKNTTGDYEKDVDTVKKYARTNPMRFEEWVRIHAGEFGG